MTARRAGQDENDPKGSPTGRVAVIVIWPVSMGEIFPGEMAALPTLAESYRKAGAKVVFLFLPQDNRPGDLATIFCEDVEEELRD